MREREQSEVGNSFLKQIAIIFQDRSKQGDENHAPTLLTQNAILQVESNQNLAIIRFSIFSNIINIS